MVGFEPTNTGATTQGLNHLTTPTAFVLSGFCFVAARSIVAHILSIVRSYSIHAPRIEPEITLRPIGLFKKGGDRERARTVDLQRDRLAF